MNLKKILSVFICVSFFWNCAFAADNLHIYERTDKPVPEEEVIYDKYGNKEELTKEKLENILKDAYNK